MKFIYPTSFKSLISADTLYLIIHSGERHRIPYHDTGLVTCTYPNIGITFAPRAEAIQVDGDWRSGDSNELKDFNNRFGIGASCQRLIGDAGTFKSISPLTACFARGVRDGIYSDAIKWYT